MKQARSPRKKHARKPAQNAVAIVARQDKVAERQRYLLQLYRRGITQPDQIVELYAKKGYDVSESTIRDDRAAVRKVLQEAYSEDVEETKRQALAQLDDLSVQFQQIAQQALDPSGKRSYYAAVQALGQKKDTIVSKAKLAGAWVEKQEHSGAVTDMNLNAEASPEEMQAFVAALKQAGFDGESVVDAIKDAA